MKRPSLKKGLGIDSSTGLLLAVSGIAALLVIHSIGTHDKIKKDVTKSNHSSRPPYLSAQDKDHHVVNDSDDVLTRIGWRLPPLEQEDEREIEDSIFGSDEEGEDPFSRVSNNSYTSFGDPARGDGFSFAAGVVDPSGLSSIPLTTTSPVVTGAISGTVPPSITATSTMPPLDPQLLDLQNRVLKMIIANTSNVQVILSSIDTIKAAIQTYTGRLSLLQQQTQLGRIYPYQLTLYLMQIVNEIAIQLQIPLKPVTMSPLMGGANPTTQVSGSSPTASMSPYQAITAPTSF